MLKVGRRALRRKDREKDSFPLFFLPHYFHGPSPIPARAVLKKDILRYTTCFIPIISPATRSISFHMLSYVDSELIDGFSSAELFETTFICNCMCGWMQFCDLSRLPVHCRTTFTTGVWRWYAVRTLTGHTLTCIQGTLSTLPLPRDVSMGLRDQPIPQGSAHLYLMAPHRSRLQVPTTTVTS